MDERLPLTSQPVSFHIHGTFEPTDGWRIGFWSRMAHESLTDVELVEGDRLTTGELLDMIDGLARARLTVLQFDPRGVHDRKARDRHHPEH